MPELAKYTGVPRTPAPNPLSCHPHPWSPQPEQSSRFTSADVVVPSMTEGGSIVGLDFDNTVAALRKLGVSYDLMNKAETQ